MNAPATGATGPSPGEPFRCSVAAQRRGDELAGTASTVSAFLLMEEPGPWGIDAWRDARLPDGLGLEVLRRSAATGVKALLIRRPAMGRGHPASAGAPGRRVFAAYVTADGGWVESGQLTDPREVLDLDLASLRAGRSVGLSPWPEPIFAVCTHGRHDPCCAERGRPVALAIAEAEPEAAWASSHLGGDRFAANLLVLGAGLYYGGLDEQSARRVVAAHRAGRLDLEHLRGRTCWPMSVQAAEIGLRRHLQLTPWGGVRLVTRQPVAGGEPGTATVEVRFAVADPGVAGGTASDAPFAGLDQWVVSVRRRAGAPVALTCHARRRQPLTRWDVVGCRPAADDVSPVRPETCG